MLILTMHKLTAIALCVLGVVWYTKLRHSEEVVFPIPPTTTTLPTRGKEWLILGDSLVAGAMFSGKGLKYTGWSGDVGEGVETRGYPGWSSKGVLENFKILAEKTTRTSYDRAVILLGTNDVVQRLPPEGVARNVKELSRLLTATFNVSRVYHHPVPRFSTLVPRHPSVRRAASPYCPSVARHNPTVDRINSLLAATLPQGTVLNDSFAGIPPGEGYWSDCVHPNKEGYHMLGRLVKKQLEVVEGVV